MMRSCCLKWTLAVFCVLHQSCADKDLNTDSDAIHPNCLPIDGSAIEIDTDPDTCPDIGFTGTSVVGSLASHEDDFHIDCVGATGGRDVVIEWTVPTPASDCYTINTVGTTFEHALIVSSDCEHEGGSCADDPAQGVLAFDVEAGSVHQFVIEALSSEEMGLYRLTIRQCIPEICDNCMTDDGDFRIDSEDEDCGL